MIRLLDMAMALIISLEIPKMFGHDRLCCEATFLESYKNSMFCVTVETSVNMLEDPLHKFEQF